MNRNKIIVALAASLYGVHVQHFGTEENRLPSWEELEREPNLKPEADAWIAIANTAVETFFPSGTRPEVGRDVRTDLEHATFIDKSLRQSLQLAVETLDLQASAGQGSRPRATTKTKLQEGAMWLGMNLGEIRETGLAAGIDLNPSPYPGSRDPSNKSINPPAPEAPRG